MEVILLGKGVTKALCLYLGYDFRGKWARKTRISVIYGGQVLKAGWWGYLPILRG